MNVMVFDIETIPDVEGGRRLYGLEGLGDKEVASVMFHKRRQETGTEFLRHHLQRIVAISVVLRSSDSLKVWSPMTLVHALGGSFWAPETDVTALFRKPEA